MDGVRNVSKLVLLMVGLLAVRGSAEPPLLVGGCAHGERNIRALAGLGVGNFVWIPASVYATANVPWDDEHTVLDDVRAAVASDLHFMVSVRRGIGDELRPGGYQYGGHSDEFLTREQVEGIAAVAGDRLWWLHGEEMDADMHQQGIRPSFRTRTPELFRYQTREGGRLSFEGELRRLRRRYDQWGGQLLPNLCMTYHHSGWRAGSPMIIAELLEHLPTTELQLAYLRGGARQFGGEWGVWVSPWWIGKIPTEDVDMWPIGYAEEGGGHSSASLRRCLYLSWVSGARLLCTQDTPPLLSGDGEGGFELGPWGRELAAFWGYAKQHPEPIEPVPGLAVLVDKSNGWCPAHLGINWALEESVWGKLPTDRTDRMLSGYLDALLPGFGRTFGAVEAREDVYPGYFAATPHGPFDIVSSDISSMELSRYPLVVVLGGLEMTPSLHATLRDYVSGGGTLLINALQLRWREAWVDDPELWGVDLGIGEGDNWTRIFSSTEVHLRKPAAGLEPGVWTEPWFAPVEVVAGSGEVLAEDHEGHPVLLRNAFGEGTVYLSTPEFMQEGWGPQDATLGFFEDLIGDLSAEAWPIVIESEGDVSWVAGRQGDDGLLLLVNHHQREARSVRVGGSGDDARVEVGDATLQQAKVDVPPEDVVVLRWTTGRG
jgi:hypothetical protein